MGSRARIFVLWGWFVVLVWLRFPHLLHHPDLYGEEAVYFLTARNEPAWRTLFAVRFGYLSLSANLGGELASWVPLVNVPLVTRMIATLGPAAVVAVLMALRASITRTAVAIALVVMTPLMIGEWATTIHVQFWLVVALTLCLPMEFDSVWRRWSVRGLAVFTVLSAALGAVLFLFFGWRAWQRRDRDAAIVSAILLAGGIVQLLLGADRRSVWTFGRFLAALLQQDLFEGLFGPWADPVGVWLGDSPLRWPVMTLVVALIFVALFGAWSLVSDRFRISVVAGGVLGALSIWFALAPSMMFRFYSGERYALAGTMPIVLSIVLGAHMRSWPRTIALVVIAMSIAGSGYGVGRQYDDLMAIRPDYWADSLAIDDGQVQANYFCRYPLEQPPTPTSTSSTSRVEGGYRVALDNLTPLLDDPSNQVFLVAAGWKPLYDQSWQDGMWISYGAISFGGQGPDKPAYVCYTGPKDRGSSGLRVDGSAVIIPDAAIDSALLKEPEGDPLFYVLIGPSYEQAIVRQQRVGVPLGTMLDSGRLDD